MTRTDKSDAAAPAGAATIDDWCHLHRITPKQCAGWLANATSPPVMQAAPENPAIDPVQIWRWSAEAMAAAQPEHRHAILAVLEKVDLNTSPDAARFPNAFTLHDSGNGRPYVCVPYTGSARDILTLAHEFGHALQILNTAAPFTPPALREVCAFLAESRFLDYLATFDIRLRDQVLSPWTRSVTMDFGARRTALLAACATPKTPYEYAWNYPLARRLALAATTSLTARDQWQLFTGTVHVAPLAAKTGI